MKNKDKSSNNISNYIGFALIFVGNYYFLNFNNLAGPSVIQKTLDLLFLLFVLLFLFKFYFTLFNKNNNSENYFYLAISIFNKLFLIYLSVIVLKTYFAISKIDFYSFINDAFQFVSLNNNFLKLIPFILFIPILLLSRKLIFSYMNFCAITGYIFLALIVYENIPSWSNTKIIKDINDEQYDTNRKVVWIILDEYDPLIADELENKLDLNSYQFLKSNSYINNKTYPAGEYTMVALPQIIMELKSPLEAATTKKKTYYLIDKNKKEYAFDYFNSIFHSLSQRGITSSILSSSLEYCSVYFIENKFEVCKDKLSEIHKKIQFNKLISGIIYTFKLKAILDKYEIELSETDKFLQKQKISKTTSWNKDYLFNNEIVFNKLKSLKNYENISDLDGYETVFYNDFLKAFETSNFIFVHLILPHIPADYVIKKFKIDVSDSYEEYLLNLKFSDFVIKKLLNGALEIQDAKTLILFQSDTGFRIRDKANISNTSKETKKIARILNIAHFLGENQSKIIDEKKTTPIYFNGEIIRNFYKGKINNNSDILKFNYDLPFVDTFIPVRRNFKYE